MVCQNQDMTCPEYSSNLTNVFSEKQGHNMQINTLEVAPLTVYCKEGHSTSIEVHTANKIHTSSVVIGYLVKCAFIIVYVFILVKRGIRFFFFNSH